VSDLYGSVRSSLAGLPLTDPIYLFVLHSYKEHLCATFVSIDCPLQFDLCGFFFFWYFSTHFIYTGIQMKKREVLKEVGPC
jgi:hypothetical protein